MFVNRNIRKNSREKPSLFTLGSSHRIPFLSLRYYLLLYIYNAQFPREEIYENTVLQLNETKNALYVNKTRRTKSFCFGAKQLYVLSLLAYIVHWR